MDDDNERDMVVMGLVLLEQELAGAIISADAVTRSRLTVRLASVVALRDAILGESIIDLIPSGMNAFRMLN